MTQRGSQDNVVTYTHFCDAAEDMENIKPSEITLGSVCIVLEGDNGFSAYIAKSDKTWVQVI